MNHLPKTQHVTDAPIIFAMHLTFPMRSLALGLAMLLGTNGCGVPDVTRYPISGTVLVDGKPAERVLVQLTSTTKGNGKNNDAYPSGYTDASGKFVIGKEQGSLGAVEGEYVVTFTWISGPELEAYDKLKGAYSAVTKSKERLKVPSEGLEKMEYRLNSSGPK
jgi:hypothetical protein